MDFKTADLLDAHEDKPLQVVQPGFHNFGGRNKFGGEIVTIKIHEDKFQLIFFKKSGKHSVSSAI